ncbi:hypothetical protein ACQ33O_09400 [Ferruginibacter sp. SUN002]|uniref:hypothetical protein n=1 Tax=Ferruginibacter sp. SUN002 TaxID=2937789 RepID=UPI003D362A4D
MKKLFLLLSIFCFKIVAAQNVGIGTISPVGALNIYKSDSSQITFHNILTGSTSSDGLLIGNMGNTAGLIWNKENAPIRFGTNDLERITLTASGNVGIGYNAPSYKLSINGETYTNGIYVNGLANFTDNLSVSGQLTSYGLTTINDQLSVNGPLVVSGNITTGGKGIVRGEDATQMVIEDFSTPANLNASLAAGGHTCCIGMSFSTVFTSKPSIAFGELTNVSPAGSIALTITSLTTTGATVTITNIGTTTATITNGTLRAMIIGKK